MAVASERRSAESRSDRTSSAIEVAIEFASCDCASPTPAHSSGCDTPPNKRTTPTAADETTLRPHRQETLPGRERERERETRATRALAAAALRAARARHTHKYLFVLAGCGRKDCDIWPWFASATASLACSHRTSAEAHALLRNPSCNSSEVLRSPVVRVRCTTLRKYLMFWTRQSCRGACRGPSLLIAKRFKTHSWDSERATLYCPSPSC